MGSFWVTMWLVGLLGFIYQHAGYGRVSPQGVRPWLGSFILASILALSGGYLFGQS